MIHAQPPPAIVQRRQNCGSALIAIPYAQMKPGIFNVVTARDFGFGDARITDARVVNRLQRAPAMFYPTGHWQGGYGQVNPDRAISFGLRPTRSVAIANASQIRPGRGAVYIEASDC
jgi:hypothetical protein